MFEDKTLNSKDLKLLILEGFFATILLTAGIAFIIPFAVFLGANSIEIGFLTAFPALLAAWLQLFSIRVLDFFKNRKKIVIFFCLLQGLLFIPIALLPFILRQNHVFWLIIFYTLSIVIGSIAGPIWQSWIKTIVPQKIFGTYFGFRNAIIGIASFAFLILFGFSLNLFETNLSLVFLGIFLISAFGRIIGSLIFIKVNDPEKNNNFEKKIRFIGFVKNISKNKFGYFVLYASLMNFGIALTGPFIAYHFLENIGLKNNYFLYTILISTALLSAIIGMNYWGKIIDHFGSIKTLKATSILVIFFPILYIIIRLPLPLIIVQFFDGIIFSGYNLALATFVFDYSSQKKIIRFGAYQTAFFGTAIFFGAIISGFIQSLNINFFIITNSFYLICVISIIIRFIVFKKLFKHVSEVRQVEKIETKKIIYSIMTFGPVTRMIPKIVFFDHEIKKVKIPFKKRIKHINNLLNHQSKKIKHFLKKN